MHRKTFAMVRVAAVVLALVFSLALPIEAATGEPGSEKPEGADPTLSLEEELSPETHYGACTLCYTCGRSWPYRRATFSVPGGRAIWELGSGCATPSAYLHDSSPYLCCNN
jgi:hypothetical protein